MKNDQGVVYVSTGKSYVNMAAMSAKSLKSHCPNLPVHIFTDCDTTSYDCFDSATKISTPHRRSKVDCIPETPYQRTLYLDADTRVCENIVPLFDLLDKFELAIAHDCGRGKHIDKYTGKAPAERNKPEKYSSQAPEEFMPLNSGVILFKTTDPVLKFFKAWKNDYYQKGFKADQLTLRDQLWIHNLKLGILPPEYNCRPRSNIKVLRDAKIFPKILHLNDFKREAGIPSIDSLSLRKKIKHKIKYIMMPKIRNLFFGSHY